MWWGVVKSKEFVDPKKPQNRVSTFEFWYLHGFPLSCRHDELSEPYLFFFLVLHNGNFCEWLHGYCELDFGLWWAMGQCIVGLKIF